MSTTITSITIGIAFIMIGSILVSVVKRHTIPTKRFAIYVIIGVLISSLPLYFGLPQLYEMLLGLVLGLSIEHFVTLKKVVSKNDIAPITKRKLKTYETDITYESIGTQDRIIDNSEGNGKVIRKITIEKEWKKTYDYTIKKDSSQTNTIGLSKNIATYQKDIEDVLSQSYNTSSAISNKYSEEIEIEILPFSKILLQIEWMRIYQNGIVEIYDDEGEVVRIPFKVTKGIIFNQKQKKMN